MIAKDLIKGDECKEQLKLANQEISELETKVSLKDSVITKLTEINKNYVSVIDNQKYQFGELKQHSTQVEKAYAHQKSKNRFNKVLSIFAIGTLTYFLTLK